MGKRKGNIFWRWLRNLLIAVVIAVIAVLWQLDREMPRFAREKLETALSQGRLSYRFEHASFSLFRGITLRDVRIRVKKVVDQPLLTVGELKLKFDIMTDRPAYTWIRAIEADDVFCQAFTDLPGSSSGEGSGLADFLREVSIDHDWMTRPIRVHFRNADVFTLKTRDLSMNVYAKNGVLVADDIRIDLFSRGFNESLSAWFSLSPTPCEIRSRIQGDITPEAVEKLISFLDGETANEFARSLDDFTTPLAVTGDIFWKSSPEEGRPAEQDFRAKISGAGLTYNDIPLKRLDLGLQWYSRPKGATRERKLLISPISCDFDRGAGTVSVAWDPSTHATEIEANATAFPADLAMIVWNRIPGVVTNFTFTGLPRITVKGRIMPDWTPEKTVVSGDIFAAATAARGVPLRNLSANFLLHDDDILDFSDIHADLFGGRLDGNISVDIDNGPGIDLALAAKGAVLSDVMRHFGAKNVENGGKTDLRLNLKGIADSDQLDTLTGSCEATVRDGKILRIPLFAGLTDFVGRNVPGMDLLLMESDADCTCWLTNGLVTVEHLSVAGNLFSMAARGRCRIDSGDFPVEGVAQLRFFHSHSLIGKLARLITIPVSKLMEFRVQGPIDDPSWSYIGLIDRIKSIFWEEEDATAPKKKDNGRDAGEKEK